MRNASGRCVFNSSGEPTFSAPTSLDNRARVTSSFSGSGVSGMNKPFCSIRGFAGSAEIVTAEIGDCGGFDSMSSKSNRSRVFGFLIGIGKLMVRVCSLRSANRIRNRTSFAAKLRQRGIDIGRSEFPGIVEIGDHRSHERLIQRQGFRIAYTRIKWGLMSGVTSTGNPQRL